MKTRTPILATLLLLAPAAHATQSNDDRMRAMLILSLTDESATYQMAARCGASEKVLKKMHEGMNADVADMKEKSGSLGIDFDKVIADGKASADKKYAALGANADNSKECKEAIQLATTSTQL